MSLTTDYLLEQQIADSPEKCPDCKWNFDDKFMEYCRRHFIEYQQFEQENRAFAELMSQEG